jgi:hypothetical protein
MSKRAKALAGAIIKAKIARDAEAETALWALRKLYRDHFKLAIGQAALHKDQVSIRLLAQAIIWACTESNIPRVELSRAFTALDLTPPRAKRRRKGQ